MTVVFAELHETDRAELAANGNAYRAVSSTRRFTVPGYTSFSALAHPDLPTAGSAHPRYPTAICRSLRAVDRVGGGTTPGDSGWYVDAEYVLPEAANFSFPADRDAPGFRTREFSTEIVPIQVPVITSRAVGVTDPVSGNVIQQVDSWAADSFAYNIPMVRLRVQVNVSFVSESDIGLIRIQTGRLHQLPGDDEPYWLFEGGFSQQVQDQVYQLHYSWIGDSGNVALDLPRVSFAQQPSIRLPHERYIVTWGPASSDPEDPDIPYVETFQSYNVSTPNGWQQLPGQPITSTFNPGGPPPP